MSSSYGENIRMTIFGQSHSEAVGMTLEGIPAGEKIDMDKLGAFLTRRSPGRNSYSTPRREEDEPEFVSGLVGNVTCGVPITAIIRNTNTRSKDYEELKKIPRPGHADYTAEVKYGGHQDYAGGGHFSGRLTAPLCIAGGICKQLLEKDGINISARIFSIGDIKDEGNLEERAVKEIYFSDSDFPTLSEDKGNEMKELISNLAKEGDSVGGIIECVVTGLPAGLGDPMFDGMENRIAGAIFGVPAIKAIEFGAGFDCGRMRGSENNDPFYIKDGAVCTKTNNCGGILGGITNGMPLTFKVAVKPTPSIGMQQESVNLETMENTSLLVKGRHDPCIVPRAVPCIEAAAALAIYDAFLKKQ